MDLKISVVSQNFINIFQKFDGDALAKLLGCFNEYYYILALKWPELQEYFDQFVTISPNFGFNIQFHMVTRQFYWISKMLWEKLSSAKVNSFSGPNVYQIYTPAAQLKEYLDKYFGTNLVRLKTFSAREIFCFVIILYLPLNEYLKSFLPTVDKEISAKLRDFKESLKKDSEKGLLFEKLLKGFQCIFNDKFNQYVTMFCYFRLAIMKRQLIDVYQKKMRTFVKICFNEIDKYIKEKVYNHQRAPIAERCEGEPSSSGDHHYLPFRDFSDLNEVFAVIVPLMRLTWLVGSLIKGHTAVATFVEVSCYDQLGFLNTKYAAIDNVLQRNQGEWDESNSMIPTLALILLPMLQSVDLVLEPVTLDQSDQQQPTPKLDEGFEDDEYLNGLDDEGLNMANNSQNFVPLNRTLKSYLDYYMVLDLWEVLGVLFHSGKLKVDNRLTSDDGSFVSNLFKPIITLVGSTFQLVLSMPIKAQLKNIHRLPRWFGERDVQSNFGTNFSIQQRHNYGLIPSTYITKIGQYLLHLPQYLEAYSLHAIPEYLLFYSYFDAINQSNIRKRRDPLQEHDLIDSSIDMSKCNGSTFQYKSLTEFWLQYLIDTSCDIILNKVIARIPKLNLHGRHQLLCDIDYFVNLLEDLRFEPTPEFGIMKKFLSAENKEKYLETLTQVDPNQFEDVIKNFERIDIIYEI